MSHETAAKPKLLVIDDEPTLSDFVAEVGELAGYEVTVSNDPASLLSKYDLTPDVIILDLVMPGFDGVEVLRRLAAFNCQARIILTSGFDRKVLESVRRLAEAKGLQVAGHLQKPVRADDLSALLQEQPRLVKTAISVREITAEELNRAIEKDQLIMHYQPQVSLKTGQWIGVEALVRWQHPDLDLLYPNAFLPLVESDGFALPFTYKVVEKSLADFRIIKSLDFSGVLSINLPPVGLTDVFFPDEIARRLSEFEYKGIKLLFEVTETSVAEDPAIALDILTRLRLKGFDLSLDDFGVGHATMEQLQQLPISDLKIDMSFVRVAEIDSSARAIISKSINLGHDLGLKVLAEGVESEWLWHWLRAEGCDAAQGYFISRPLPVEALAESQKAWIERNLAGT